MILFFRFVKKFDVSHVGWFVFHKNNHAQKQQTNLQNNTLYYMTFDVRDKIYIWVMAIFFRELVMDTIWTIVIILFLLWLVGFFALPGVGAFIHILLVIAVIVVIYRLATGRNVVTGK